MNHREHQKHRARNGDKAHADSQGLTAGHTVFTRTAGNPTPGGLGDLGRWILCVLGVLCAASFPSLPVRGFSAVGSLPAQAPPPAASSGSVQGLVASAGTVEPLARVVVELRGEDDRMPAPVSTITEADGRFAFRTVRGGRYRLLATRPGYVSRPISITVAGGRTEEVAVTMTATGAIAGRVSGQSGEPLGNVEVAALKSSYVNGQRILTAAQSVRTNDRGEYRLFWLAPGRYLVRATHPQAASGLMTMFGQGRMGGGPMIFGGGVGPNGFFGIRSTGDPGLFDAIAPGTDTLSDQYVPIYFPGTHDDQAASVIDLRAGAELGAIDVPVIPVRERHVRGVVINGATGQVAQYAGLSEVHAGSLPGGLGGGPGGGLSNGGQNPIDPDGSFDVALLPGRHTLMGTAGTGAGFVTLAVGDADQEGVRIVAMPAFNVTGRIVTDAPVENADLTNVRVSLWRELPVPTPSSSYSLPRADGTFVVAATPGSYRMNLAPFLNLAPELARFVAVPKGFENAYVKSMRLGEVDVLNGGVHLEGPTTSVLEIVLGMNPGSIDGTVLTAAQSAAAGATVALLPDLRGRFDLVRTATTDASGHFRIDRVAPGGYKLFAWNEAGEGDWLDPDVMRASEGRGTPLRVVDGTTARVRLVSIAP